jgi:aspartate-semialdehyde dehydrogenase
MGLTRKERYTIAVVGATGAVGREMIEILEERKFPIKELRLLASSRSAGSFIDSEELSGHVVELTDEALGGLDLALFSAGADVSRQFAPVAVRKGAVVIDNSSAFRMDPTVPLVVPEVNQAALARHQGLIANPNCSTIQMVMVLKPLHAVARIRRVVVTTFQSVSGTGKEAMDELLEQCRAILSFQSVETKVYPHQIAFNCLPHIDNFEPDGYTKEEMKLVNETKKILDDPAIHVTATTVRVPVFRGHSESINIDMEQPMTLEATGQDSVYVGRIREDRTVAHGLNLWVVSDNLRKGAALNAVQIAEQLIQGPGSSSQGPG